jgi:preprotein translocase subunit SecA
MPEPIMRPGIRFGPYPERLECGLTEFEQSASRFFEKVFNWLLRSRFNQARVIRNIEHHELALKAYDETALSQAIDEVKAKLQRFGMTEDLTAQAFAIIREAAFRTIGKRHFNIQLIGGWMMVKGMLVEMATGEGKTLTATLPACTAAMAGIPVHVITANDYLAARDAEIMHPLYQRLGLRGAFVIDGMDAERRKTAYQHDIVHTTNKQIAFDYLRDRLEIGEDTGRLMAKFRHISQELSQGSRSQVLLRGLCFAIVDEADSVLIDEAKTPLIITKPKPNEENPDTYSDALYLANSLMVNTDFSFDRQSREIEFTEQGEEKLARNAFSLPKLWENKCKREKLVKLALNANYFYKKNQHYIVHENKVQIIDEFTGRIMPDRSWEQGLHQMIEAKEGCNISEQRETLAQISYQRFFRRYLRLAGTSGTVKEVAGEIHSLYGLSAIALPTHRPSKRILLPELVFRTTELKRHALIERIAELYQSNRPVLVGTSTVAESEEVSSWLKQAGYPHQVLNAMQDKHEAEIIAQAGQSGAITVATNMAGRGTDIILGAGVAELGGLYVIALNKNESSRVDRQLYGRCARQGDPGSAEAILSLQDAEIVNYYSSDMITMFEKLCQGNKPIPAWLGKLIMWVPQYGNELKQRQIRRQVMKNDQHLARLMAFTGKFE